MDKVKVLIVDDEAVICEGLKADFMRMRHGWEYEVDTAQSVVKAEEIYYCKGVDIVITDINMPKGSGLILISQIRSFDSSCGILVLSAYDNFEYVRNAFTMGADDYLLKPISFSELEKCIGALMQKVLERRTIGTGRMAGGLSGKHSGTIADITEYVHLHIGEKLSAAEFAKKMAVSYSNFGKMFREHTGMSFSAYVLSCRMERAKEYLENPHIKIKQVAAKVGYRDNPQHFSRDFTRYAGLSPKEYRTQILESPSPAVWSKQKGDSH